MPFWGAQQSSPPLTPPKGLKPGEFVWSPGIAPAGPIVVVVSLDDQLAFVYRNGVEIGRAKLHVTDPLQPLGAHAFIVGQGDGTGQSALLAGAPARNLIAVSMPGYAGSAGTDLVAVVGGRIRMPHAFAQNVYPLFVPGTTLVVVDAPILTQNSGLEMTVLANGAPTVGAP
jgi:hypothetical protein